MANRAELEKNEIIRYIGKKSTNIISKFTKEDWEFFRGLHLSTTESYYVEGTREDLDKFKAFFLVLNSAAKVPYKEYALTDFVSYLSNPEENEDLLLGAGRALLILNHHDQDCGTEKQEAWINNVLKNKAASRKMKDLTTIILTERTFLEVKNSSVFNYVNLSTKVVEKAMKSTSTSVKDNNLERWKP